MRTNAIARLLAGAIGVSAICLLPPLVPDASTRAQPATPGTAKDRPEGSGVGANEAEPLDPQEAREREERRLRAREDVEILELQLGARRAQVQTAEMRLKLRRSLEANYERMRKKGVVSPNAERQAELNVVDAESRLAMSQFEFAEVAARFNQARQRLASIERGGGAEPGILEAMGQDLDDLKARMDRIEKKFDLLLEAVNRDRSE